MESWLFWINETHAELYCSIFNNKEKTNISKTKPSS